MRPGRRLRLPWFAVSRPRLNQRLDAVAGGEVCTVVAPAGSGKSVLMAQWATELEDAVIAWVDVVGASADPIVFARQLVDAIDGAVPATMEASRGLFAQGGGFPGPAFVAQVLSELSELDVPLVLVFDDVERAGAMDFLTEVLDELLDQLPDTTRAFVIARWDPHLDLHRWRLDGRLHEVRSTDLAFDVDEAAALVRALTGIELEREQARRLCERSEGWAAGVQLAAFSIGHAPDPARFIDGFAGTDIHVADYLVEEVLNHLDAGVRQFLVSTSILPWLSVDLCAHVLESLDRDEVAATLDFLEARGLFLVPVDDHGERVRYHQLFADLLLYELRRGDEMVEKRLRRRAAEWFSARQHLSEAAEELVALDDATGLLALVREHGQHYYERNESATLARWLSGIRNSMPQPPVEVEIHLLAAQFASHQVAAATSTAQALRRRTDLTRGERAEAEGLHALLGLHDLSPRETERAATTALKLVRTLQPGDCFHVLGIGAEGMVECFAWFMRGQAAFYEGDLDRATEMLNRALATPDSDYVAWRVYVLGALALVEAWKGHLTESEALSSAALARADGSLSHQYVGLAYAHQAAALVALDRMNVSAANSHLERAQPIVDRSLRPPLVGMQQLLRIGTTAEDRGATAALETIERSMPTALQPRLIDTARRSLHTRLLLTVGRVSAARSVVGSISSELPGHAARIDVALALDDRRTARAELERWDASPADLDSVVGRHVRDAAITWRDGSRSSALRALDEALSLAAVQGLVRPFVEVPVALALLRTEPQLQDNVMAKHVLTAAGAIYRPLAGQDDLVEPLTERELEILALLPSRLSNDELASALFISVNTLKTHLRHIYVKLDAQNRDDAIDRAAFLGLL